MRQETKLKREQPQLVIGTPGRIWDLIKNGGLDVHTASQLVIDEADMTLDMGFLDVVDSIAASFGKHVQMMVFFGHHSTKDQCFSPQIYAKSSH